MTEMTESWAVPWAPHVTVRYSPRVYDHEVGAHESQRYKIECAVCGAEHGPVTCSSGMVRTHAANFASAHVHRDVLNAPMPKG